MQSLTPKDRIDDYFLVEERVECLRYHLVKKDMLSSFDDKTIIDSVLKDDDSSGLVDQPLEINKTLTLIVLKDNSLLNKFRPNTVSSAIRWIEDNVKFRTNKESNKKKTKTTGT